MTDTVTNSEEIKLSYEGFNLSIGIEDPAYKLVFGFLLFDKINMYEITLGKILLFFFLFLALTPQIYTLRVLKSMSCKSTVNLCSTD